MLSELELAVLGAAGRHDEVASIRSRRWVDGSPRSRYIDTMTQTSTDTATATAVQTPTGMVHAARTAVVHGRSMQVPACTAVNGYTGLRASWPTTEAVTCKKCLPSTRVSTAEGKDAKKARLAAERKASALALAEQRVRGGERLLAELLSLTPSVEGASAYAASITERVADLATRRADLAALQAKA